MLTAPPRRPPHLAVGGSRLLRGTRTFRGQTHPLKPCLQLECPLLLREATPSPEGIPYVGVALQALLHEVVEVRGEGAVIGVGGRVAVGGPGGAGGQALTQAGVGCRARGAHGQLLGGDGAGVQQAGHGAVQFLQQHLGGGGTEPGLGWKGAPGRPTEFLRRYTFPNAQT